MKIYSTPENLIIVQDAITQLVKGKRKVSVEYTSPTGDKTRMQYTEVSLGELRSLASEMINALNPVPLMEAVDVEILF